MEELKLIDIIFEHGGGVGIGVIVMLIYAWRHWLDYKRGSTQDAASISATIIKEQRDAIASLRDTLTTRDIKDHEDILALRARLITITEERNELARQHGELKRALKVAKKHPELIETIVDTFVDSERIFFAQEDDSQEIQRVEALSRAIEEHHQRSKEST